MKSPSSRRGVMIEKKGGDDMDLEEAEKLADKFYEWAGDYAKGRAKGATHNISWFIQTLYEKGYEIIKKGDERG